MKPLSYSGPLQQVAREASGKRSLSGPVAYAPNRVVEAGRNKDYSGSMPVRVLTEGHLIYLSKSDFDSWGGYRSSGEKMSLAKGNLVNQLAVSGTHFHHRYGTRGDFESTPVTPGLTGYAFPDPSAVAFDRGGLLSKGGYASAGSPNTTYLQQSDTSKSLTMGGWVEWGNNATSYLWGYENLQWYDSTYTYGGVVCKVGWEPYYYGGYTFRIQFGTQYEEGGGGFVLDIPPGNLGDLTPGSWYQLLVSFSTPDGSTGRLTVMVNGRLVVDMMQPYGWYYVDQIATANGYGVGIGALASTEFDGVHDYGARKARYPWLGAVDEVFWANWKPTIGSGVKAKYIYDDYWGGTKVNPDWVEGDEVAFTPPARHEPVSVLGRGSDHYIMYGPVEDVGMGSNSGISRVRADFSKSTPTSGQEIFVSVRASDTSFTATSTAVPWSSWFPLDNYQDVDHAIGGVGLGRYVQARVKMYPSDDVQASSAPQIDRLDLWVTSPGRQEVILDIPGHISTTTNFLAINIPGHVSVKHNLVVDFPGHVKRVAVMDPIDIPGHCAVATKFVKNFPGHARITQGLHVDIPGHVYHVYSGKTDFYVNFNGHTKISKLGLIYGFPGHVRKQTRFTKDIPGHTYMNAILFQGHVRVRQKFSITKNGHVKIILDAPFPPTNLRANVPFNQWEPNPNVTFQWDAAQPRRTAVVKYRYHLDLNPTSQFEETWDETTSLSAAYNLATQQYGPGQWWFHIVAISAAGYASDPVHACVWFNRPPSTPGVGYMRVNGQDTLSNTPLLSSTAGTIPNFTWSPSSDLDGTSPTYQVQFAYKSDFSFDSDFVQDSITRTVENGTASALNLSPILKSGIWFWRIRAWDGRQYSEWSQVGSFRFNAPPLAPSGLVVSKQ